GEDRPGALPIGQKATVYHLRLGSGETVTHKLASGRRAYVFVIGGSAAGGGAAPQNGDAAPPGGEAGPPPEAGAGAGPPAPCPHPRRMIPAGPPPCVRAGLGPPGSRPRGVALARPRMAR